MTISSFWICQSFLVELFPIQSNIKGFHFNSSFTFKEFIKIVFVIFFLGLFRFSSLFTLLSQLLVLFWRIKYSRRRFWIIKVFYTPDFWFLDFDQHKFLFIFNKLLLLPEKLWLSKILWPPYQVLELLALVIIQNYKNNSSNNSIIR